MLRETDIIAAYQAGEVNVEPNMRAWMRSNHAGETGAVWIYKGAACAFWNKRIMAMATEHGLNEQRHLIVMEHLLDKAYRSRLLILWRISGFTLGLLPSLFGYRAFCITIEAVETFVEQHYQEQIQYLYQQQANPQLRSVLQRCCDEEVEHQHDAANQKGRGRLSPLCRAWCWLVGSGSGLAVRLAKAV